MKIFICNRGVDVLESESLISDLLKQSENSLAILRETEHSEEWKKRVESKFQEVDFILFLIGSETFKSDQIKWEYEKAKELNKQIVGVKLPSSSKESILFCEGFPVFDNSEQCLKYLRKVYDDDRLLRIEQYKIMVGSTEKVTEQRLNVNNLFFTVTSSILSVAFVFGNTFNFSVTASFGMLAFTLLAFLVTYFWEKLINSYGKLNTGKFKIIDKIEKQLRSNMFEEEWKILTRQINYESNTKTEATIVMRFRIFILLIGIGELIYIGYKLKDILLFLICRLLN